MDQEGGGKIKLVWISKISKKKLDLQYILVWISEISKNILGSQNNLVSGILNLNHCLMIYEISKI